MPNPLFLAQIHKVYVELNELLRLAGGTELDETQPERPPVPPPNGAPNISLPDVTTYGSHSRCLSFPATATLHSVDFDGSAMTIHSSNTSHWPAVSIDGGEPVQAGTLWVFLQIDGLWLATGAERLRPSQLNGDKPEGPTADLIGDGWLYDSNRWGPMAGYNPKPGEWVGFMLVAGSTRSDDNTPVEERSNVLMKQW